MSSNDHEASKWCQKVLKMRLESVEKSIKNRHENQSWKSIEKMSKNRETNSAESYSRSGSVVKSWGRTKVRSRWKMIKKWSKINQNSMKNNVKNHHDSDTLFWMIFSCILEHLGPKNGSFRCPKKGQKC